MHSEIRGKPMSKRKLGCLGFLRLLDTALPCASNHNG